MSPGQFLTVRQALTILPIGRSTLYSLIAEHQIPSIRVKRAGSSRGRILIRREDLDAFIKRSQSVRRALLTQSQGNERGASPTSSRGSTMPAAELRLLSNRGAGDE